MNVLRVLPLAVTLVCPCARTQSKPAEPRLACNRLALSADARKRHFDVLGPALRRVHKRVRELSDGYEFEFPNDAATLETLSEWVVGERLCCPFFEIDLRLGHGNGAVWLRLTGGGEVKQFIRSEVGPWFQGAERTL